MMIWLVWQMPSVIHRVIASVTGYVPAKKFDNGEHIGFTWVKWSEVRHED